MEKNPDIMKPHYGKHIKVLPVPWPFCYMHMYEGEISLIQQIFDFMLILSL